MGLKRKDPKASDQPRAGKIFASYKPEPEMAGRHAKPFLRAFRLGRRKAQDALFSLCLMLSSGMFLGMGVMPSLLYCTSDMKPPDLRLIEMCRNLRSLECKVALEYFERSLNAGYIIGFALPAALYATLRLARTIRRRLMDPK